jgi:hypothetical protein
MIDPVLMGAVEQKLIEALLRLQEAFKIMNHLKQINGYEVKTLAEVTKSDIAEKAKFDGVCQVAAPDTCLINTNCDT